MAYEVTTDDLIDYVSAVGSVLHETLLDTRALAQLLVDKHIITSDEYINYVERVNVSCDLAKSLKSLIDIMNKNKSTKE